MVEHYPRDDFGFGCLTGWVCVPKSASKNATSSFEPTWIMSISFSSGWSRPATGEFRTIWFHECFRRVSSRVTAFWPPRGGVAATLLKSHKPNLAE
ncbi:hypothetical protein [Bradyrhizobium arachidis]|uniref:hypothetical protein n=1 Tax=Bradyrhizobium arachidis TaxID=858423 RepID=UPI0021628AB2|nr:hypothetical protein [Bradyrhizobium arachidis]UVO31715.1 hypothetical protein KUF59_14385 [Bradyrhizobium arachidis]